MATKFKPSERVYKRGVPTKQLPWRHFYIKNTPKQELIDYINSDRGKPKIKQKCRNELVRRGIKLVWVLEDGTQIEPNWKALLDYAREVKHG